MARLPRAPKVDLLLAATIGAASLFEVWREQLDPAWASITSVVLLSTALVWRRSYPIAVGTIAGASAILEAAAGVSLHESVAQVVGTFLASWSIGAYAPRARAVLGLVVLVGAGWLAMGIDLLRGTDPYSATDFPWLGALVATPGALGIAFGARTRSLHRAEARAAQLELDRREAIAEERARIGRELHDVIAHSVSVMTVQAGAAEEMLKVDPARAVEPVRAVQETGRQALVEMKRLVGMLREHDHELGVAPQPSLRDVERLVAQVREAGTPVELRILGTPRPLPVAVELSAYRVVQEALTNSLKHAVGAAAVVTLRYGEHELEVEVADEGRGSSPAGSGHGLVGMRERVAIFGGTFEAGPRPQGGFVVRVRLSLQPAA